MVGRTRAGPGPWQPSPLLLPQPVQPQPAQTVLVLQVPLLALVQSQLRPEPEARARLLVASLGLLRASWALARPLVPERGLAEAQEQGLGGQGTELGLQQADSDTPVVREAGPGLVVDNSTLVVLEAPVLAEDSSSQAGEAGVGLLGQLTSSAAASSAPV